MQQELNATITKRSEINHGLLVIQVKPDFPLQAFTAGQYAVLGLPGSAPRVDIADPEQPPIGDDKKDTLIRRAYSITSSSLQGEYLEFYVALVHSGALTPRLFALKEGDRLFLGKKIVGMFTLTDVPKGNDVLLIATGTGLAPYVSMLRSSYAFQSRTTVVIHGARTSWDLGYRNQLQALAAQWPNLHYLPVIDDTERDPEWSGKVGFVESFFEDGTVERLLGDRLAPKQLSVFLCGNPLMIESMMTRLGGLGFTKHSKKSPGSIFVEEYWKD